MTEETGSAAHTKHELAEEIEDAETGDVLTFDERVEEIRQRRRESAALAEEQSRKFGIERQPIGEETSSGTPIEQGLGSGIGNGEITTRAELSQQLDRVEDKLDRVLEVIDDGE